MCIHGYSTKDETIVVLQLVKDFIIERGRIEKIKVTQELLRLCERVRERYGAFLEQQKKLDETSQSERRVGQAIKRCCIRAWNDIQFLKKGIDVSQKSVEEGNHELGEAMKGKTLN